MNPQDEALRQYRTHENLRNIAQGVNQSTKFSIHPIIQRALTMFGQGGGNPIHSVGGRVGPVGATVGVDGSQPFGSYNVNGNVQTSFGPQGADTPNEPRLSDQINGLLAKLNPLQAAGNAAQDIGTGIRSKFSSGDLAAKEALAKVFEQKGDLKTANMIRQQISEEAGGISKGFSPDVKQNPLLRGAKGGLEGGALAALVSSALQSIVNNLPAGGAAAGEQAAPGAQVATTPTQNAESEISHNAIMNKIPQTITPDARISNPNIDSWVTNQNMNDPKAQFLRNLARDAQYGSDRGLMGGRGGFLDLNAPIGGDKITERAIKEFGTTNNPDLAAFLTKDGEMIDGSGLKQGSDGTQRLVDHGEIANAGLGEPGISKDNFITNNLAKFMTKTGNTRIISPKDSDTLYIDTATRLTPEQIKQIGNIQKGRTIYVDITNHMGGLDANGDFNKIDDLIKFINKNVKK